MQLLCRQCGLLYTVTDPTAARCPQCGYSEPTTKSPRAATTERAAFSEPVSQPYHPPMPTAVATMVPYGQPAAAPPPAPYGAPYAPPPPANYPQAAPAPVPYGHPPVAAPMIVIQNQVNAPYPYAPPMAPYAMQPYVRRKDGGVAALLSFFLPGLGQFYNGQTGKGLAFLLVTIFINFPLAFIGIGFLTGIATWIWAMVDAHQSAERINRGEIVV
jgi:TM2 domain-containing membrane protein YozV